MHKKKAQGFTLVELLITIAILGLLVVVALPAYRESVLRSNRSDAQITLNRLATLQEQYYFRTNQYTDDFANLIDGATSGVPIDSNEGHYSISVDTNATATDPATTWTMTAEAQPDQAADTACNKIILNSMGVKTAERADTTANNEECWR